MRSACFSNKSVTSEPGCVKPTEPEPLCVPRRASGNCDDLLKWTTRTNEITNKF